MKIKQYDAVRLKRINALMENPESEFYIRQPAIDDVAYIIEIYSNPSGC
jgi:hypothetical protein